ncbi:MAG: Asp-tRNA(Asn)/Glu-tRNA(Gln) amidotransferase subunit GatC [Parcubacteria group bacterium]|nr:Asp-tRNA(Asn)/Glu-tRNA(Gln) amidotransferase subunit GatC [Parcubacteria group bacterium]
MSDINKKTLEHLADLARINLDKREEEKLLKDLKNILDYFEELRELSTENIEPLAGGVWHKNAFREDEPERTPDTGKGKSQFPESEKGYLKVPPVFE